MAIQMRIRAALAVLALFAGPAAAQQGADLLIRGGTIYDGSEGSKGFVGDIAITGDRITYVGPHAGLGARRTIDARGMIVSPGFIDGHSHSDHFLNSADPGERRAPAYLTQGVSTVLIGVDGNGQPELRSVFARYRQQGIGVNAVSYVGFGAVRTRVIGQASRAPNAAELATEKQLVAKGMCEGALGLSAGLFYAPQSYAKTDEVVALAKEAARRGGIYDTHQRDEFSYSIGLINSTKEVLQIGREAGIPVHFSHIKALGKDVWGKSADVIKLIQDAKARGQNVTANQYPWLASQTGLSAALVPRWAVDGGYAAMIKRFNDAAQMPKIRQEMAENLRRRGGPQKLLLSSASSEAGGSVAADASDRPWSGRYLDEMAKEWKVDPVEAAIRIMRQTERQSVVSFNMEQRDVDTFMKQPWVVTSSDGVPGHPREWATFSTKYADYVKKRNVITLPFFIRHATGLAADIYMLDKRGYLRSGYYADVLVFDPNNYAPKADYTHPELPSTGVVSLVVNGKLAIDNGNMTGALSGRPLPHTPKAGTCL